jgi:hypothetical protein
MKQPSQLTNKIPSVKISLSWSPLGSGLLFIALALIWFQLSPKGQAVSPPPDGGYGGRNTAEGSDALFNLTSGHDNTALGSQALFNNTDGDANTATGLSTLSRNSHGSYNTATGAWALVHNEIGSHNTATGVSALEINISGYNNTATGRGALFLNDSGSNNTANGFLALSRSTGQDNTATGAFALAGAQFAPGGFGPTITGSGNTVVGYGAMSDNASGNHNTATGYYASFSNTTGSFNTAAGDFALSSTKEGVNNTAIGANALLANTNGSDNTANGYDALFSNITGYGNTASGDFALFSNTTGRRNIALGYGAGYKLTEGNYNIDIGNGAVAGESNTIRLGTAPPKRGKYGQTRTFIAGIHKQSEGGTDISAVYVNSDGQLGTQAPPSSRRFKEEIKAMDKASEGILGLKPVTFHYKSDSAGTPQFGLIAEEVAKVNPDLVVRDKEGKPYSVRYEQVNAMLLNEFLKEHRKVERLEKQVEALAAGLQKVSAQLESSKPAPQVVNNP